MKILMVLTEHSPRGGAKPDAAFWLAEFAAPYYAFKDAGAAVTLASRHGDASPSVPAGTAPARPTGATHRFEADPAALAALAGTRALRDLVTSDFDAVFYPDGPGPHWDWPGMHVRSLGSDPSRAAESI